MDNKLFSFTDGPLGNILRLEGKRDGAQLQDGAGVPGEELRGDVRRGHDQAGGAGAA